MMKIINKKTIAFQGAEGANSHLACMGFYPSFKYKSFPTFFDVFRATETEDADYGMVPLENSYAGRVSEIHNLLQDSNLFIVAEHFLPISHNIAVIKGTNLGEIEEVISHPQALMQCQKNLHAMNIVKTREFSNTAEAAKFIALANDKGKAAICSIEAAKINGLEIIAKDIQDQKNNVTIFITIAKKPIAPNPELRSVMTSLIFTIGNEAGSLYRALGVFAKRNISIVKLESYIPSGASKKARFFVTIENQNNKYSTQNITQAINELQLQGIGVKALGSYYSDKMRFLT